MASLEDHCAIDERHLGRRLPHVHRWLDEFFVKLGNAHRRERHHQEGVEDVRERWGSEAARSAELHIVIDMGHLPTMADWKAGGIVTNGIPVPMDAMGIPDTHVSSLASGIVLASATPYKAKLECTGCDAETEQFLVDIRVGDFLCSACRQRNQWPDYRIALRCS